MPEDEGLPGGVAEVEPRQSADQCDEIDAWLDTLSEDDLWRVLCSRELSEVVDVDVLSIRSKSALRYVMRELGIAPAKLSPAVQSTAGSRAERDQETGASNVILFRPRPRR